MQYPIVEIVQTGHQRTILNKANFIKLYKDHYCNISATCEAMHISRNTFYEWCKNDIAFKNLITEAELSIIDWVETRLLKNIRNGDTRSLIFFLTNRSPKRWQDKKNFTGDIKGGDTTIHVHPQKTVIFTAIKEEVDANDGSGEDIHAGESAKGNRIKQKI